ncbi:hypothetical protein PIROE2DRAFT_5290, partial [Piromyces sp. E2]
GYHEYQFDINQYIKNNNMVLTDGTSCYPCYGETNRIASFTHWIIICSKFSELK